MRFLDTQDSLYSFGKELLVECPHCKKCANVKFDISARPPIRTYVCAHCGHSDRRTVNSLPAYTYAKDWNKRLGLWLQTPCSGHVLWALNERHLEFLELYVAAELRERRQRQEHGWSNQSLASRLPRWLTSAKNRDEALRGLQRLKDRLLTFR